MIKVVESVFSWFKSLKNSQKGLVIIGFILMVAIGYHSLGFNTDPVLMNGGTSGIDGTHAPYSIIIYPEVNSPIGYFANPDYEPVTYRVPIKFVVHDFDGDLATYIVDWKITPSWGYILDGNDEYVRLTSGVIEGTLYDREITTTIEFDWWWSGIREYNNFLFDVDLQIYMTDDYGNDNNDVLSRTIDGRDAKETELTIPAPGAFIIQDNGEESEPDIEIYFDDPNDNYSGVPETASLEIIPIISSFMLLSLILKKKKKVTNDEQ